MRALHLGYHYIRVGAAPGPTCTPERLRLHIQALKSEGYVILSCREVARRFVEGRSLPERHATLSFDDGLKDQVITALPILIGEDVPATFFVIACSLRGKQWPSVIAFQMAIDRLGVERLEHEILPAIFDEIGCWSYRALLDPKLFTPTDANTGKPMKAGEAPQMRRIKAIFNHFVPPSLQAEIIRKLVERYPEVAEEAQRHERWFLSVEDLIRMHDAGMEIASHTVKHPWLNMIGESEIEEEARASHKILGDIVGIPATIAWTFGGDVRPEAQAAIARAGYLSAWNFRSAWDIERFGKEDIYRNLMDIPRLHEQSFNP